MNFALENETSFPEMNFTMLDGSERCFHVVVVRSTYLITTDGALEKAIEQAPVAVEDEYFGEPHKSSVKQESDLALFKPRCDVIVNGTAYPPEGLPVNEISVGITMRNLEGKKLLSKFVVANCMRHWEKGFLDNWDIKDVKPLESLPIRYEYAYGGNLLLEAKDPLAARLPEKLALATEQRNSHPDGPGSAPVYHEVCAANPLGRGYADSEFIKALNVSAFNAPLIEEPNKPIRSFMEPYPVQGLGIIGRSWRPRVDLAGTYDDTWRKQRHPYLPKDFDFGYFNCAHPDLQIPYPGGGEEISLYNLCRPGEPGTAKDGNGRTVMKFKLPAQRISLAVESETGKTDTVMMDIDTLIMDCEEKVVSIVYRKLLPVGEGIRAARIIVD